MNFDILSFGEPLVGFYPAPGQDPTKHLSSTDIAREIAPQISWVSTWGGDTSNVALASSKLGLSSAYLTRVGDDIFGQSFISLWREHRINTDFVQIDPERKTGLYFVSFQEGKHHMTYYRKDSAAAHILSEEFDLSVLRAVKVLHLSGISLGISVEAQKFGISLMKAARQGGTRVSLDLNYRPALWGPAKARSVLEPLIREYVDILEITDDEMEQIGWGIEPEALSSRLPGPSYYLVKQGERGASLQGPEGSCHVPAFPVPVMDTVGAGDAFDAGFLNAFLRGAPLLEAGRFASAVAALVCTGTGPLEKQPSRKEVETFLHRFQSSRIT